MQRNKVLHLLEVFSPINGIGTLLRNYAREYGENNMFIVSIAGREYALDGDGERAATDELRVLSIKDRLAERSIQVPEDADKRNKLYARELLHIINEEQPDCIHIHYSVSLEYVKLIRKQIPGIKIFFTCHGRVERIFPPDQPLIIDNARMLIKDNNMHIIALHSGMQKDLQKIFGMRNIVVLNNCISLEYFRTPKHSREEIRGELGIPEDAFVIGHVGMFAPVKNHEFLVRLFVEAFSKSDKAFLLMVGRGSKDNWIRYLLDNLGLSDRYLQIRSCIDTPELLSIMDVFVLPSLSEGFSMALLEAQAAGLPCIKSDKVPDEEMITSHIVSMSLDAPVSEWCELLLHPERIVNKHPVGNIEDYDSSVVVKELDQLYKG